MNTINRHAADKLSSIARQAMLDRGLLPEFSAAVERETATIDHPVIETGDAIRDLRHLAWASIDNDDSRDLDQLTVAETLAADVTKILVAIADVDATIALGTAIDSHAQVNTTSVYTAAGIFPMLPEKFSTDFTSLAAGQERMAVVVEMTIDADGNVGATGVFRARVVNHAKLAYNSIAAWLDGEAPAPAALAAVPGLDAQLRLQDRVAQALKRERHARGALRLETLAVRPVFADGVLSDLQPDRKNRAKELIEDFMIAANSATANFLEGHGFPSIRRVLGIPKRWDRIVALAAGLGERLPAEPSTVALDAFLNKRRAADPDDYPELSLAVVKLLGSGEYALERPGQPASGHFGLAVNDYTHSTAPNRRFPDLIAQRLVKAALAQRPLPYAIAELDALARHCTLQEDNAAKVERQVQKSAAALLLARRLGARFDGIVTGASDKGTWVRITKPVVEGRLVSGYEGLDVGDRVRVQLVRTDAARGFIDFSLARNRP